MALVLADRVKQTSTTAGTGTFTLSGAATGFQTFAVIGDGNTTFYCIAGQSTSEWEVGIGTYTASGTTLARTTVLSNSSATQPSALSFSAGTKDVFVTYPSSKSVNLNASDIAVIPTLNLTNALGIAYGGTGATSLASASIVTYAGSETLTNKTLTNPTVTNYVETPFTANSSTAITLALTNGTVQIITLTGTATITMPTAVSGKSFMLLLKTGAGGYTVTWSTVQWPSGTAPTLTSTASKMDKFVFTSDGTNWYGSVAGQNYTV